MLFKPNYGVSYKGKFYRRGDCFDIAETDAAEMSLHGVIERPQEVQTEAPEEQPQEAVQPRQGNRRRAK